MPDNRYELRIPIKAVAGDEAERVASAITGKSAEELRALGAVLLLAVGGWGPGEAPERWPEDENSDGDGEFDESELPKW